MSLKKEILMGITWGLVLGLLVMLLVSIGRTAEVPADDGKGNIDISITDDSVKIDIDKDGMLTSISIVGDSVQKIPQGITVTDKLLIEDGKIYIDGAELTEDELNRLSVNKDEESTIKIRHGRKMERQLKRKRLATVYTTNDFDLVKFDDIVVDSGIVVDGDVVSISGDISVLGYVKGDVISVFGDIFIDNGAYVQGDVTAPFGKVTREPGGYIKGKVAIHKDLKSKKHYTDFGLSLRFDRVEGLTLLSSLKYIDKSGKIPSVDISGAYAFTLKRWEYDFGINHQIGKRIGPYFGARMFQLAETPDRWILTELENTLAGLLFKEDFYDFFWTKGLSGEGGLFVGSHFKAGMEYTGAKVSNLKRTAAKAIFGGKKKFRENWSTILPDSTAIIESAGKLKELTLKTSYDSRNDDIRPSSGLFGQLQYQKTVGGSSSDFDYQVTSGEIKAYIPVASNQTLFARVRGGYSDDNLPLFRQFFVGGIGSLRGYEYKEFEGNRYMLFNADYIWYFYKSDLGAGLFFDTGKASNSGSQFESAPLKSDLGLCLLIDNSIRIDFAQRLDDVDKSPVVSLRGLILF